MIIFTVYENPKDYPGKFVIRRFVGTVPDQQPTAVSDTLQGARADLLKIHPHLVHLSRRAGDDPVIVETWL